MKQYLIDSNSLISPYRTFYQFDLIPAFWDWFKQTYDKSIYLVDKVRDELCHATGVNKDQLQLWIEGNCLSKGKIITPNTDSNVLSEYKKILKYIKDADIYTQRSFDEWSLIEKADPWLIAIAKVYGYTIVTMEERDRNLNPKFPTRKEPRIPDVCAALGVDCINLYELMKEQKCLI